MIEIKRLGEERWREVRDLRQEALERESAAFCSAYKRETTMDEEGWRRRTADTLFAVSDGRPVGMIALGSEGGQRAGSVALLYGVYVRRESRGQGIGRRLVEGAIEAICENPEVRRIELTINASGPSGAAAAAHFTAVMNVQPLSADPSIGGSTTDWRDIPDLTNASGLVIERMLGGSPVVRVAFKQPLDLCGASAPAAVASIGTLLKTGKGSVYLDVDAIPALNSSAEVRMFGLTDYGRPGILVNGVPTVMVGQTSGGPVSGLA